MCYIGKYTGLLWWFNGLNHKPVNPWFQFFFVAKICPLTDTYWSIQYFSPEHIFSISHNPYFFLGHLFSISLWSIYSVFLMPSTDLSYFVLPCPVSSSVGSCHSSAPTYTHTLNSVGQKFLCWYLETIDKLMYKHLSQQRLCPPAYIHSYTLLKWVTCTILNIMIYQHL